MTVLSELLSKIYNINTYDSSQAGYNVGFDKLMNNLMTQLYLVAQ